MFPEAIAKSAFEKFDVQEVEVLSFRDVCVGLAKIMLATDEEIFAFFFNLFDIDNDR